VPRICPSCYRASRTGSSAARDGRTSAPSRDPARGPVATSLTLTEVLARYDGGPDGGVFTDGSASPNPGPGGWGAVYVVDGEVVARDHGHDPGPTTNNRMELIALHRGIELVPDGTPAVVYSDSNLVVRTMTEWAPGWERRGWKRKTGPVENLDLVRPLYEALRARPELTLRWIKAHAGNRWNEYADSLATAYLRETL
jgi:ribonuclease HI